MKQNNENIYYELEIECSKVVSDDQKQVFPRFNILSQSQFKVGNNTLTATLSDFQMHKEVNTQCKVDATLTISVKPTISLMKDIINELIDKKISVYYGGNAICSNYYIFEVRPKQAENYLKVDLTIFSADKYLTIKKYSKVYTAKKLGEEIFKAKMDNQNLSGFEYNGLLLLRYCKKGAENTTAEVIQPYLVQYNESFYDFILRSANRCGEFLFFENGTLHLGIGTKEQKEIRHLDEEDCYSIEYSAEDFEEEPLDEEDFYSNSFKSDLNTSERKFAIETTSDEYLHEIEKSQYDNMEGEKSATVPWQMALIQMLTHAEGLGGMIAGTAITMMRTYLPLPWYTFPSLKYLCDLNNEEYDAKYFDSSKINKSPDQFDANGEKHSQFGTIGERIDTENSTNKFLNNLDVRFYSIIRRLQNKLSHKEITVKYAGECKTEFHLGDEFEFEKKYYIVRKISAKESSPAPGKYSLETEVTLYPIYQIEDNIDIKFHLPIAPKADIENIKRVQGGIEAEVVDNLDPARLGRVRVKYLWSGSTESETSPWVKVIAPQSTPDGGTYFMPQVGDRVMLEFENENIEKPFVSGSVFTNERGPVWGMRAYSGVISSSHGHAIKFYSPDSRGRLVQGFIPAADMIGSFFPAATEFKGADKDYELKMLGGIEMTDSRGIFSFSTSSDHRNISVQSPFGTVVIDAFTGLNISAPNGDITIEGKNVEIVAGNKLTIKSGTNINNRFTQKDISSNIVSEGIKLIDNAVDLPLLRTTLQFAFSLFGVREAENAILLKSTRNLDMEIGEGEVFNEEGSFQNKNINTAKAYLSSLKIAIQNVVDTVHASVRTTFDKYEALRQGKNDIIAFLSTNTELTEEEVKTVINKAIDNKGIKKENVSDWSGKKYLAVDQKKTIANIVNEYWGRIRTDAPSYEKATKWCCDALRNSGDVIFKITSFSIGKIVYTDDENTLDKYYDSEIVLNEEKLKKFKRDLKLTMLRTADRQFLTLPQIADEDAVLNNTNGEWNNMLANIEINIPSANNPWYSFITDNFDTTEYKKLFKREEFLTPDLGKIRISDKPGQIVTFKNNAPNNASVLMTSGIGRDLLNYLTER